jgi:tetratricopeptide (TPR) repeat protein
MLTAMAGKTVIAWIPGLIVVSAVMLAGFAFASGTSPSSDPALADKPRLPEDSREVAQAASEHFKNKEYEAAADCYQQIIDQHPDSLYAWSNLGVVRYTQQDYDRARTALEQAVALSPKDEFSWSNLGLTSYQLKRFDDAINALENAVKLNPQDAVGWNYLGCCYTQKGDREKADAALKKAVELDRNFGDAYFNLALLEATAQPPDLNQAKIYYHQALDLGIARDRKLEKLVGTGTANE